MSGPALHAGPQLDQLSNLRLDDLDPLPHRQRVVPAGGIKVEMQPVLAHLQLRHPLEPDRRPQPGRIEKPIVEADPLS